MHVKSAHLTRLLQAQAELRVLQARVAAVLETAYSDRTTTIDTARPPLQHGTDAEAFGRKDVRRD
jgi:hypothetical protein